MTLDYVTASAVQQAVLLERSDMNIAKKLGIQPGHLVMYPHYMSEKPRCMVLAHVRRVPNEWPPVAHGVRVLHPQPRNLSLPPLITSRYDGYQYSFDPINGGSDGFHLLIEPRNINGHGEIYVGKGQIKRGLSRHDEFHVFTDLVDSLVEKVQASV